jgi:hypothetical protein
MSTKDDILFQKKLNNSVMSVQDSVRFVCLNQNKQIVTLKLKLYFNFNHLDKDVISELNFQPILYINKIKMNDEFIIDFLSSINNDKIILQSNIDIIEKMIDDDTNIYEYSLLFNLNSLLDESKSDTQSKHVEEIENQIYDWVYLINNQKIL